MWLKRISYGNSNYLVCSFIKTTGTYFCVWSLFKRNPENYTHLPWSQKWGPCIWYYDWKLHLNIEKPRKQKWKDLWMPLIRIHFLDLTHSKTIAKTNKQKHQSCMTQMTHDSWKNLCGRGCLSAQISAPHESLQHSSPFQEQGHRVLKIKHK